MSRLLAILLAILVPAMWSEVAAGAQTTSNTDKAAPAISMPAQMEFYLARGEADACGRGCPEWIAAEGKIDAGAASRLRRLVAKLGRRRPPIYFHSPGGSIAGAIELGRLIREQKLEVSVARTVPRGCDRDKPLERSCEALKHSGQDLEAEVDPSIAMCNSACVYAVAGGSVRLIPPWVSLGIHDIGFDPDSPPPPGVPLAAVKRVAHERLEEYLHDMGFDEALFRAASAVPFESHRFLDRDELVRFGIDRRDFGETDWQLLDRPKPELTKRFFSRTGGDQVRYVDALVSLNCGGGQTVRLALARKHSEVLGAWPRSVSISLNGERVDLLYQFQSSEMDMRWASLPVRTFDALRDDAAVVLSGTDFARNEEAAGDVTLRMDGFAAAYAKLRKSCDDPGNAVAAAVPARSVPFLGPEMLQQLSPPAVWGGARPPDWPAASIPTAPHSAASAANTPEPQPQPQPARQSCAAKIPDEPQHFTGRVTGFPSGEEASARTRSVEVATGAQISPAYASLPRVMVEMLSQGFSSSTMAAVPEDMAVKAGDLVEITSRYRDQSLPCHFIPWTIDRLVSHTE